MDANLLDILVCPICKGELKYLKEQNELCCRFDRLAFPIKTDIAIMLAEEARPLNLEEYEIIFK